MWRECWNTKYDSRKDSLVSISRRLLVFNRGLTSSRDLRGPVNFRRSLAQGRGDASLIFLPQPPPPLSPESSLRGR